MCGIAGGLGQVDAAAMVRALGHRGPDDQHTVALGACQMGTARLAIVDIAGGRQPLENGGVWVALNGQIYNHKALRRQLELRGVQFKTHSDTEVVAALVATHGFEDAIRRLDGFFGIAAWDGQRLYLARDRHGKKPLYWTRGADGRFLFGSELRAILVDPGVARRVDPVALQQLLLFELIPAPRSIYEGIQKLAPGHWMEAGGQPRPFPIAERPASGDMAPDRWERAVEASLQVAVRTRLPEEVEAALLLSGGIDSSLVGLEMARQRPGLRSFSVVFDEPSFDESGPARAAAARIGSQHTELRFRAGELAGVLEGLDPDEPLADGGLPSAWVLARGVRAAGFKVALGGDGADEAFGGYPTYPAHSLAFAAGLAGRIARRLPASTDNLSPAFLARRFAAGAGLPLARRHMVWLGAWLPSELDLDPRVWEPVDGGLPPGPPAAQAMALDQRLYLAEGVLQKVDRASMAHGVEVRCPWLDAGIQGLAAELPLRHKVQGHRTKVLLRRIAAQRLGPELAERPKKGFGTPLGPWLRGPCRDLLQGLPEAVEGMLDPARVRACVEDHLAGRADERKRLWTAILLAKWRQGRWGPG